MKKTLPIKRITIQRMILFFFIVVIGGVVVLCAIFYQNNQSFHNTNYLLLRTHSIIEEAGNVASAVKDVQWESRTFVLTRDPASKKRYYLARDLLRERLVSISQKTADNPGQQPRVHKLTIQIDSLLAFTDKVMDVGSVQPFSWDFLLNSKLNQNAFYSAINQEIEGISAEENGLLAQRGAANSRNLEKNYYLFIAGVALIFLTLVFAYVILNYSLQKRKIAEKRTAESEHNFRTLLNSIKDLAIFTIDTEGRIRNWYTGASNMKGYRNEEVIGENIAIFYTPDAVANGEPEKNLRAAAAAGSFETEGWRVRKDGSVFWADVMITPIYDADGKIEGFTKVTRDFSLHKRAEDEIKETLQKEKELNAMKSNFVSLASHEFRTPLSTILTSIVLLEQYRTTETQDKRDRHIQRIRSSVNEMVNILEEFLSLEKIEERKVEVKYETFDLKQLSEHVRDKFATQLPRSDQIQFVHSGDLNVFLDRAILEHILTNLLSNAVKYSPEGKEIVLETAVTAQYVELKVKDRGIGISPADQKHLFERFFRASNTGGIKGTGLGLHIVKRYVDLLKGTIRVKSNLGVGSEFAIMFFTEPAY